MTAPYYEDDGIVLYCGDARELLGKLEFDLLLTDPPYGIGLSNHDSTGLWRDRKWSVVGDHDQGVGTQVLQMWDGPTVVFASPMKPWPGKWRQHLVWDKGEHTGGGADMERCWKPTWELIQVRGTGVLAGKRDGSVLRYPAVKEDYTLHPTAKSVSLLEYLIYKTQPKVVCDPFCGSGSTLVAAKRCGVRAIGIEIEERYCRIAAERCRQRMLV